MALCSFKINNMIKIFTIIQKKHIRKSHISGSSFACPTLSAAVLNGVNHKITQRIYSLLRDRIVEMAIEESKPFFGTRGGR
jgi:hypothetical protein